MSIRTLSRREALAAIASTAALPWLASCDGLARNVAAYVRQAG